MRGRFAPSPTGDLHLGGATTALASYLRAKSAGDVWIVRMEDLDPPRVVAGASERILDDLRWLGLAWDEGPGVEGPYGPYEQSRRGESYRAALAILEARGLVYPCTCTRAEIARAASAPHAGEEGPRYPGTCRDPNKRRGDRPAALRLRVPDDERARVAFDDVFAGRVEEDVAQIVGDFVLRRAAPMGPGPHHAPTSGPGVASYQLAVVVDDLAMRIDEVVRGGDLLASTARQILLARLLDAAPPRYAHVPLVLGPDGERLAKRHQSAFFGTTIAELRASGVTPDEILGELGAALGALDAPRSIAMDELIERASTARSAEPNPDVSPKTPEKQLEPRGPWRVPLRWLRPRG